MAKKVYAAQAVLALIIGFSSRIFSEGSAIPPLLFLVICILTIVLMWNSYEGRTAPEFPVTQLSGAVSDVVSKQWKETIVPDDMFMGQTEGRTEFRIGSQAILMRCHAALAPGDVVTVAGIAGDRFEALAIRHRSGITALPTPKFPFTDPKREMALNGVLTVVLYGLVVCTIITRRFDKMWSWRHAIERATNLVQTASTVPMTQSIHGQPLGGGMSPV